MLPLGVPGIRSSRPAGENPLLEDNTSRIVTLNFYCGFKFLRSEVMEKVHPAIQKCRFHSTTSTPVPLILSPFKS